MQHYERIQIVEMVTEKGTDRLCRLDRKHGFRSGPALIAVRPRKLARVPTANVIGAIDGAANSLQNNRESRAEVRKRWRCIAGLCYQPSASAFDQKPTRCDWPKAASSLGKSLAWH